MRQASRVPIALTDLAGGLLAVLAYAIESVRRPRLFLHPATIQGEENRQNQRDGGTGRRESLILLPYAREPGSNTKGKGL